MAICTHFKVITSRIGVKNRFYLLHGCYSVIVSKFRATRHRNVDQPLYCVAPRQLIFVLLCTNFWLRLGPRRSPAGCFRFFFFIRNLCTLLIFLMIFYFIYFFHIYLSLHCKQKQKDMGTFVENAKNISTEHEGMLLSLYWLDD